jgi:hypothetical protein
LPANLCPRKTERDAFLDQLAKVCDRRPLIAQRCLPPHLCLP